MPNFDPEFLERIVCVSTAHITQKDSELLSRDVSDTCTVVVYEKTSGDESYGLCARDSSMSPFIVYEKASDDESYGYFVRVPDLNDNPDILTAARAQGYSEAMIGLVTAADEAGCSWLEIDCDGPTYEDFPTFEW